MKRTIALALALIMAATLLAGCGSKDNGKNILKIGLGGDPAALDPRKIEESVGHFVANQIYEGLVTYNDKCEAVPACAEKWEVSADGLVYTFHLRQGLKWSNGDPLTAKDFEYGIKSALAPAFASPYASILYFVKNAENYNTEKTKNADDIGVKAINDTTLQITLEAPCPYFVSVTAYPTYYPVNQKSDFSKVDKIVCNGPFRITDWTRKSDIDLVKNDQYYDKDAVKLDGMNLALTDDNNTLMQMFKTGQVSFMEKAPVAEIDKLIKDGLCKPSPQFSIYYYDFNNKKKPFDDVRVRKAFNLGINRQLLIDKVTKGAQQPALAWVPYGAPDAAPGSDFRKVGGNFYKDNDIEAAKKLLAEAGYPGGKGFPEVTLKYNTNDAHKAIAEAIQEMWKTNLGVTVKLQNEEWKVFLDTRKQGDYDIARDGWNADYPDAYVFACIFTAGNDQNNAKYLNKNYDSLINSSRVEADPAKRFQLMHEAEKQLMEDMPICPIYFYSGTPVYSPKLKGVIENSLNNFYFKTAYMEK